MLSLQGALVLGEDAEAQILRRLTGKRKLDLFHEEGREKVTDALKVSMQGIRRPCVFSRFEEKLPFVIWSYI